MTSIDMPPTPRSLHAKGKIPQHGLQPQRQQRPRQQHRQRQSQRLGIGLLCLCLIPALLPATLSADDEREPIRTLEQSIPLEDDDFLKVTTQVGRVEVTGRGGWSDDVRIEIEVYCQSDNSIACDKAAEDVEVEWRRGSGGLVVGTRGSTQIRSHHIRILTRVSVPEEVDLQVRLGVGDLVIEDMEGDIEARAQTGNVDVSVRSRHYGRVEVATNFGDAALYVEDGKIEGSGLLRQGVEWSSGDGSSYVKATCGAGDVTVRLR